VDAVDDTDNVVGYPMLKAKKVGHFSTSRSTSNLKRAAVKNIDINIDIADILESEISANIDINNDDIDPALLRSVGQ